MQGENGEVFRNHTSNKTVVASPVKSDLNGYHSPNENDYNDRTAGQSGDDGGHFRDYLHAPRAPLLSKHDSVVSSSHDGDSVFDLYGGRMSMVSGVNDDISSHTLTSGESPPYMNGSIPKTPEPVEIEEPGASKWIHRDKLAQIEGNEAADYLYDVGQSRWIHKDKLERIEIEELQRGGDIGDSHSRPSTLRGGDEGRDHKQQYRLSLPVGCDEDDGMLDPDFHEIRTPEEQASDSSGHGSVRKNFRRNRSYSRIPLATVSPHPIPQQFIARTTPLPRTAVTPNGSDDGRASISHPSSLRKRSYSAGSAMMLDDRENSPPGAAGTSASGAGTINNPKIRTSITSPTPRHKTASRTGSMAGKQRTRSNPQLAHRPGTSASYATHASVSAPGSANKHPEGQPPWALSGYKPDPSLPPDQQIIPTLARRLQQDQWERDGVYASVYDKELRPLKVLSDDDKGESSHSHPDDAPESTEEWPLKSSTEPSETRQQAESAPTDGGYRTVPSIHPQSVPDNIRPTPQIKQMQSVDDSGSKKKFCCCVVM
ncbi:hypothetical protein K440DRAFT_637069 [Wilcoxina mikolae CBS 423.85]|nr:hypothetical protein K440DRAFT_637069 [Wilcoxina mikolae CBS 423.85]